MTTKKKSETHDRFRITCVTNDINSVGSLFAELIRREVTVTNCELVTDVLRYKYRQHIKDKPAAQRKKAVRKKAAKNNVGQTVITKWVAKRRTFTAKELLQFAGQRRITESACWAALRRLRDDKLVRRIGSGEYQRAVHHRKGSKAAILAKKMNGSTEAAANG